VLAQFVVDTLGRADMSTFHVLKSTDSLFTQAVYAALPRYQFTPAELGGRNVRQLVQMPFQFNVTPPAPQPQPPRPPRVRRAPVATETPIV
jgi:protein TonB